MHWLSFAAVCGIALVLIAVVIWSLVAPADPHSPASKAFAVPTNEGTYARSSR